MRQFRGAALALVTLTAGACSATEPLPLEVAAISGTWDYSSSFVWQEDTVVTRSCDITGVVITMGAPIPSEPIGWPYAFVGEASGGTLACTGEGAAEFVLDLATRPVGASQGGFLFSFYFDIATPTETWKVDHTVYPPPTGFEGHVLSNSMWSGSMKARLGPNDTTGRGSGHGSFTTEKIAG